MINLISIWSGGAFFLMAFWTLFQWIDGWPRGRRVIFTWGGWVLGGVIGGGMGLASGGAGVEAGVLISPLAAWISYLLEPSVPRVASLRINRMEKERDHDP